ncbi:hypothetical protein BpHYR1_036921 [Brachionus plicatilis]|uniref:Uncharacterized protein n=1 Tax=Brachionus plicatilis TaxID=10195 RepID=A0A3M7RX72_BRAPC|nr:hypothetical protein BpHYR1_036921 [Brachionus plicatilis]
MKRILSDMEQNITISYIFLVFKILKPGLGLDLRLVTFKQLCTAKNIKIDKLKKSKDRSNINDRNKKKYFFQKQLLDMSCQWKNKIILRSIILDVNLF